MRDDVTTCRLEERVAAVRPRVERSPYGFALVVSAGGTLLGRLRNAALDDDQNAAVAAAMEPGPSTVRADISLESLQERLDKRGFKTAVVTTPDGVLLGVVRRQDLTG
jgi:CBS domain-containing protein